ncbi:Conserved hypothetical protein [Candidatus Protochlamydia naegleriophila]|uniref:Uncharacterized protein n=1 Tax=Candidatus Protochlamydia naegleriophila TaxID=389348 RepID=A0A0U5J7S0_9BACT|nr:hypothetical protein [Candidatus Protochlamydia naegleriophila]CUI15800.1 Conserved hypothetical protein [Candidatus Protochlamydia naegleriophila]
MIGPNNSVGRVDDYMNGPLQETSNEGEESKCSVVYVEPEPVFGLDESSQQFIDDFFKKESYFSKATQEFTRNIFDKGGFTVARLITDQLLVQDFINELRASIQHSIALCSKINFSKSYEKEKLTYPSTHVMEELVESVLSIRKKFSKFRKTQEFLKRFDEAFKPFLLHLEKQIKEQASESRALQIEKLMFETDSNLDPGEKEFQLAVAQHHLEDLKNKPGQYWSELNSILNLSRFDWIERQATRRELKFFQFITTVYDRLNPIMDG